MTSSRRQALACFAMLALVGLVVHVSSRAQELDADLLELVTRARTKLHLDAFVETYVHSGDVGFFLLAAVALVAWTAGRHGPRTALVVAAVLVAAPLTAEILKVLTAEPRPHDLGFAHQITERSWPSGHTTGAATLALCASAVTSSRRVAVLGALHALAMGFSVVALVSHFPSDVLGAYLLSAGWVLPALGTAGLPQRL